LSQIKPRIALLQNKEAQESITKHLNTIVALILTFMIELSTIPNNTHNSVKQAFENIYHVGAEKMKKDVVTVISAVEEARGEKSSPKSRTE